MAASAGTWLSRELPRHVLVMRWCLLGTITCGLMQKPVAPLAWGMEEFLRVMTSMARKRAAAALLGGTAILLRKFLLAGGRGWWSGQH